MNACSNPNCSAPTPNPAFCSRSCAVTIHNAITPKRSRVNRTCKHCGVALVGRRTVCDECNPFLVDWDTVAIQDLQGRAKYQISAQIRCMARRAYRAAGLPRHCAVCGYSATFDVCHIVAIKDFPATASIASVNARENLVALCKNHHWELDHGILKLALAGVEPA